MKKSELRKIIREEILKESKKIPKKGTIDYHEYSIAIDTIKNPNKGLFLGGVTERDAIKVLKKKYGYSNDDIRGLKK